MCSFTCIAGYLNDGNGNPVCSGKDQWELKGGQCERIPTGLLEGFAACKQLLPTHSLPPLCQLNSSHIDPRDTDPHVIPTTASPQLWPEPHMVHFLDQL